MTSRKKQVTQTKVHQNKQYQDILNKYKKMAGEYKNTQLYAINKSDLINNMNIEMSPLPITSTIKKNIVKKSVEKSSSSISPVKISENKTGTTRSPKIILERESISKDNQGQLSFEIKKQKPLLTQVSEKMNQTNNLNGNKQRKSIPKDKNKTQIKFLVEKQHEVLNSQKYNLKLMEVQSIKPDLYLNSTKRSSSLPLISKNSIVPSKTQQEKNDRHKSAKGNQQQIERSNSRLKNVKRPISIQNKVQKQRQLNSVAFSLLNLKQRISDIKGVSMASSRMKNNTSIDKKLSQSRQIDNKQYQSEYWINKNRVLSSTIQNNSQKQIPKQEQSIKNKEIGNNDSKDKDTAHLESEEKKEVKEIDEIKENGDKKIKIIKLRQKKEQLEQIKQDIQNENLQKEELLRSHRDINKNLQMDVKNKSQRITQLQNELIKMQSQNVSNNKQKDAVDEDESLKQRNTQSELQQLEIEKREKEKKYNKQKQQVKQEIKKIEQRILEQELKYKTLKSKELQIKNEQLIKKQEQLIEKNKQLGQDLQKKTRELQQKIKSQQQKLYVYKLQLEEQNKKNEDIWKELKKQEQLQDLLIQQIQKIMKEKDHEAKAKQQKKQQQKIKMMEEIKALQETECKLLTEYKRDSEAVNSIFQAMRLKNIELQNNIKQKLKKKEKEKQVKQKNQLQQNL